MYKSTSLTQLLRLWTLLGRRRQLQCSSLVGLMFFSAIAEVISIGALLPFLSAIAMPEKVFSYPLVRELAYNFGIENAAGLLKPFTIIFIITAIVAGIVRLLLLWTTNWLAFSIGADLSMEIYRRTLYQPYSVHIARNSSEIISGITTKTNALIFYVILSVLTIVSSFILLVFICGVLLYVNPLVAMGSAAGFGGCYLLIAKLMHTRLMETGDVIAREQTRNIKILQEGLGGIRDVLLDNSQSFYCDIYRHSDQALRRAQGISLFINGFPRYTMESVGVIVIAIIAYLLSYYGGIATALPTLGALAVGSQRLLPALQQSYNSWSLIIGNQATLADTLSLLEQPLPKHIDVSKLPAIDFEQKIKLEDVKFRYSDSSPVVLSIKTLSIPKGARIGIVGSTGSGKSTFLDIIMGLISPTAGCFSVDGHVIDETNAIAWQRNIAHVPQNIFLSDGSFAENIALGIPRTEVDMTRVKRAAALAQIADFIESTPNAYNTLVGERGICISGGQRQRVGIARALYKEAKLLVMDEATSALDNETEKAVMDSIENLHGELTMLIVAHRLSTLQKCDFILNLKNGELCQN